MFGHQQEKKAVAGIGLLLLGTGGNLLAGGSAVAQTAIDAKRDAADEDPIIIVTGTRSGLRTSTSSLSPIDVISRDVIAARPENNLNDILATSIPSFNVQSLPGVDGLAITRPAALRNLSPDQTLVLVNGHRRHRSAYVDVLYTGAQAIDLGQISSAAIGRVEVLRDGASAQYGSDAIAGVINVVLDTAPGTQLSLQTGQYYAGDGLGVRATGRTGIALPGGGSLSLGGDYERSEATDRSIGIRNKIGQPSSEAYHLVYNLELPLDDAFTAYSFGTLSRSSSTQQFSYRAPNSAVYAQSFYQSGSPAVYPDWNLGTIYPDGFIPRLRATIHDGAATAGVKADLAGGWKLDASVGYGRDAIGYGVDRSINASLGPLSPMSFDAGEIVASQTTANLDASYLADIGLAKPVSIAFGGGYTKERFAASAGETASYQIGPLADLPGGSYGFPGLAPENAGSYTRDNLAAYLDTEVDLTRRLSVGAAGRYEHFSDFGSNFSYKLSARYQAADWLAVRATYNTGFHAPAPGQESFTKVSTAPDSTRPAPFPIVRTGLVSPDDPLAAAYGGKALKPEKSRNISAGLVLTPAHGLSLTVDYYHIAIDNRIAITPQLQLPAGSAYDKIQFLTNGYDTRSDGVDVVGSWTRHLPAGLLTLTAAYSYNRTRLSHALASLPLDVLKPIVERGRPHHTGYLSARYDLSRLHLNGALRYYGAYVDALPVAQPPPFQNQTVEPRALVDLSVSYDARPSTQLTVGANNLLNTYPDRSTGIDSLLGYKYPLLRPYDFNGGYWYVRIAQKF
jgi:iron complex outermembrane receptor protein